MYVGTKTHVCHMDAAQASFGYKKLRFKSQIVQLFATIHNATETIRVQIVENNRTIWDLNLSFL